jgi:NTE family protein
LQFGAFFGTLYQKFLRYSAVVFKRISFIVIFILLVVPYLASKQYYAHSQSQSIIIRPELSNTKPRCPNLFPHQQVKRPRVGLVLSGGGSRGIAAIGVLRALERYEIPLDLIVGTSMGSVVGGLYAMGYSTEQLQRMVDTTNWDELLSYNDEARRRDMFLDQKIARDKSVLVLRFDGFEPVIPRLTNHLNLLTLQGIYHPDPSFDDLRIPFRAVTTDLVTGKRIVIDRGDMTEAMRASMAVPLLFSSVRRDTMQLLDGGLVDNLPVDVAINNGVDVIIAVDLTSPLRPKDMLNTPWEVADQITTIMMQEVKKLSREKANLVITPDLGDHLSTDFSQLDTLIVRGLEATEEAIPRLKLIIRNKARQIGHSDTSKRFISPRFHWTAEPSSAWNDSMLTYERRGWILMNEIRHLVNELYEDGDYSQVEANIDARVDSTFIEIRVTSYPILYDVLFSGNQVCESETLRTVFSPIIGKHLNVNLVSRAMENLLGIYRDAGYSLARVRDVRFDSTAGIISIALDEGKIFRIDIKGTKKTRDWIIWRELPWHEKEVFNVSDVAQGISNVYGTGLFEQILVSVHHEGDAGEHNVATIRARERSTELIRLGLRTDNERNIQPSVDIRDENLLGAGVEAGLFLGGGTRNQSYIGEIKATRIFNSYLTFGIKAYSLVRDVNSYVDVHSNNPLYFKRDRNGEYREVRNGGLASFGLQLERLGSVTIEGRLERQKVYNIFNQPINNDAYNISSIRVGTNIDTQDKMPYPTDGVVMNFYYESTLISVVEGVSFTKMYFSYDKYQTIIKNHTIHPRIIIGVTDALKVIEKFSLGGQQNFFGYREDSERGRQLLIGSFEYQYKLPFNIFFDTYVKARYDLGSVWPSAEEMRLVDFKHGIGITVGFDTPLGPAEFAVGRGFYLREELDRPVSWGPIMIYFNIGYPIASVVRN